TEHNNSRAAFRSTAVPAVWPAGILPADSFINSPGETPGGPTNRRFVLRNANSSCLSKDIFARVFGSLRDSVKRIASSGDFFRSCPLTKRETDGGTGAFHRQTHRKQNMRCSHRPNHAGRTARRANAFQILRY